MFYNIILSDFQQNSYDFREKIWKSEKVSVDLQQQNRHKIGHLPIMPEHQKLTQPKINKLYVEH